MDELEQLKDRVINYLKSIYDPEIPVDIYRLGLIYSIELHKKGSLISCDIEMTLTSPACPVAESLIDQVYSISNLIEEIDNIKVDIVFDPPWNRDMMSDDAKLELGLL